MKILWHITYILKISDTETKEVVDTFPYKPTTDDLLESGGYMMCEYNALEYMIRFGKKDENGKLIEIEIVKDTQDDEDIF